MREWHHFYLGLVLLLVGFIVLMQGYSWILADSLMVFGLWMIIDDYIQHRTGKVSLLHKWYAYFYHKYKWIRKVNEFFDNLFK